MAPPLVKLQIIKPAPKPLGRADDMTRKGRRDIMTGNDWMGIGGEFAGASDGITPFTILRGVKTQFSVPVDIEIEEPGKSYRVLIRGIPKWIDPCRVYYYLVMFLSRHHLLMVSGLEYVEDLTEKTQAAWVVIDGTEEATRIFDFTKNRISFPVHKVFQLPKELIVEQKTLELYAFEQ